MSTYKEISYGSTGDDVKKLQELLNSKGNYNLDIDGSFGPKTQSAVKDYQQQNNLKVDGIVGTNTWGALTKEQSETAGDSTATVPAEPTAPTESAAPSFSFEPYKPSDAVAQAEALLKQQLAQKPGSYQSAWQTQLDETLKKILNREEFSYDLNGDMLYQQYKDQAVTQGQQAAMDVMGQAQAMTGGYGNSYAQTVGQQTYQGHLQQLNDVVPELYQLALEQHNREGDELYRQYGMYADREALDYGRYRDQMSDYYTELGRLTEDARYQGEQDYGRWADKLNMDYGMHRDQIADQQWQAQFDEAKRQYDQQYELQNKSKKTASNPNPGTGDKCPKCGKLKSECVCTEPVKLSYYDELLGAVSTAKGAYSKQDYKTRNKAYQETVAAINDAYKSGRITAEEKSTLLKIATPGSR